jgi:hypothetical protein
VRNHNRPACPCWHCNQRHLSSVHDDSVRPVNQKFDCQWGVVKVVRGGNGVCHGGSGSNSSINRSSSSSSSGSNSSGGGFSGSSSSGTSSHSGGSGSSSSNSNSSGRGSK